ncbi:MAG TPA: class I SAM-dependent methyltransferase [Candidatus Ozemobacteraceae bacterium]|nr:class I SAM-dependent methyltransferase [Candidatus Ozemobacteraceae bacterium]
MKQHQAMHEQQFHDGWARDMRPEDILVQETMEAATQPENRYLLRQLGDLRDRRILDLGSGAGETAIYLALKGARVTASDLSAGMLDLLERRAAIEGAQVTCVQMSAERLPFADATFDIVYASNVLHHVPLEATLLEVRRVLKPGGVLASWDPVAYNPLINVYRRLATKVRTSDEHPFRVRDYHVCKRIFPEATFECFWFLALMIFIKMFAIDRLNPNQVRYWKYIVSEHRRLEALFLRLDRIDRLLCRVFPLIRWFCYNIAILAPKTVTSRKIAS